MRNPEPGSRVRAQGRQLVYESGEWEVDLARRELRARGVPVPIGGRAFEIIEVLVQSAGELVTKNDLSARIWPGAIVEDNTLQFHISAIRKALGSDRGILKTAARRGSWLRSPRCVVTRDEHIVIRFDGPRTDLKPGRAISNQFARGSIRTGRPNQCRAAFARSSIRLPGGHADRGGGTLEKQAGIRGGPRLVPELSG